MDLFWIRLVVAECFFIRHGLNICISSKYARVSAVFGASVDIRLLWPLRVLTLDILGYMADFITLGWAFTPFKVQCSQYNQVCFLGSSI